MILCKYGSDHQEDWDRLEQLLTFEYSTQTQRATGKYPYILIFPCKPPFSAWIEEPASSANDMQRELTPWNMPSWLLRRTELLEAAVSAWLWTAHQCYNLYFDKNVQRKPTPKIGDGIFVNDLQFPSFSSDADSEITNLVLYKFLRRTSEL